MHLIATKTTKRNFKEKKSLKATNMLYKYKFLTS